MVCLVPCLFPSVVQFIDPVFLLIKLLEPHTGSAEITWQTNASHLTGEIIR